MNKQCTSMIYGGLGNVLFQISIALSFSKDNNLDYSIFKNSFGHTTHTPNIEYFNTIFKKIKLSDTVFDNNLFKLIKEEDQGYNIYNNFSENICFDGYFQSYKYFDHNRDYIIDNLNICFRDLPPEYCAVHVRRGDYLSYPHVYEILNMSYYMSAMEKIGLDKTFLVFTNDVEFCMNSFKSFNNVKIVDELDAYKSLCLMASCKHHIIANSTFSWWGAYLSSSDHVIAPSKWFKYDFINQITKKSYDDFLNDLIPNNWKLL